MTRPSFTTTTALVRRNGGCAGSAKARSSAAASAGFCAVTIDGPAMSGNSAGCGLLSRQRDGRGRAAVIEITAGAFAIDGMGAAETEQRHRDVLARPVDAIIHRPADQVRARHRGGGFGKNPAGLEAGDEGLRTEDVGEKTGRHFRRVVRPCGGQRQRACRGSDQKQFWSGHGFLRHRRTSAPRAAKPEWRADRSPDLEIALAET